jgi:hypothetical protein
VHITAMSILLADSLAGRVACLLYLIFHVWAAGFTPPVSYIVLFVGKPYHAGVRVLLLKASTCNSSVVLLIVIHCCA